MCDDETNTLLEMEKKIIGAMIEHFQHPERPDEFLIEYPPKQIIIIFQILKEYRGGFTSLQFKLYCNTIQTITCVGYSLKPE